MPNPQMPRGLIPSATSYGFKSPGGGRRTDVAGGRGRYAMAYARGTQYFSVTLVLDLYEFSVWNVFYLRKIAEGTITFDMPLDSGHGVALHACNIVPNSYDVQRTAGVGMVVAFEVEALSQAQEMSEETVESILAIHEEYGDATPAIFARLARFVLVDSLVLDL